MDFLHRTPFFRLVIPLMLGIVVYHYSELSLQVVAVMVVLACLLVAGSFLADRTSAEYKFRWLFGSGIFLFLVAAGLFVCKQFDYEHDFDHQGRKGIFRVEITEAPVQKAKSMKCRVEVQAFNDSVSGWEDASGFALLYLEKDSLSRRLQIGDQLLVAVKFRPAPGQVNPDGFNYRAYLKRQGIAATAYVPGSNRMFLQKDRSFSLRREADGWRRYLLAIYRDAQIKGDEFAVLAALTLGYTDDLQPDIMASYSATGAMHVLSVSGMHVGIIYVVISFLLRSLNKTRRRKLVKALFIIAFLWGYAFLSGLSAAVIRAALMFSFVSAADCFDRKTNIYNTVFASAFFMLLFNPNYLFDVGFQLSYSAVLSIVFFQPILNHFYRPSSKPLRLIWGLLSVSVAAQVGTAAFTLYYFQQFPNYFLLTNMLVIPLSTIVLYLAILLPVIHALPLVGVGVAKLLEWTLLGLNGSVAFIEQLPYSVWHVAFDYRQMIVVVLALCCFSAYYYQRQFASLLVGCVSLLVALLFNLYTLVDTLQSRSLVVYSGQKASHLSFVEGQRNAVFTTDSAELHQLAVASWQKHHLNAPENITGTVLKNDGFMNFEGLRLLILTTDFLRHRQASEPLQLDYLIVVNHLEPCMRDVLGCVHPRKVVVDKTIPEACTNDIRQECAGRGIAFYAVAEQGAFVLKLKD